MNRGRQEWLSRQLVWLVCAVIVFGPVAARADEQEPGEDHAAKHEAREHQEHEFHRHHLSIFLGATTADVAKEGEHGEVGVESEGGGGGGETERVTEASIGLDYEYRLNRAWGAVVGFEYVGGDARAWMAGVGAALHPVGNLKLLAGPGVEHHEGENEFLFRLGVMYDFEVGVWSLTPALNVDFVDGDQTYVYGLYIGKGF